MDPVAEKQKRKSLWQRLTSLRGHQVHRLEPGQGNGCSEATEYQTSGDPRRCLAVIRLAVIYLAVIYGAVIYGAVIHGGGGFLTLMGAF